LTALFIGHQDRIEKLTEYARKNGVKDYFYDPEDKMSEKFGITYGAGFIFIDREGIVKGRVPKAISSSRLEEELKKIL
jgi:hypothetical protein